VRKVESSLIASSLKIGIRVGSWRIGNNMNLKSIEREPLLKVAMGDRTINGVDVRRIRFGPGQQTGRHFHPCPVFGYVVEGTAVVTIEGEPAQTLPTGSAFYEPANAVVAQFDNASGSEPMTFIAFYLLQDEQDLITMLDQG
jgi:quercetin dioxygenase-like cupin family protein